MAVEKLRHNIELLFCFVKSSGQIMYQQPGRLNAQENDITKKYQPAGKKKKKKTEQNRIARKKKKQKQLGMIKKLKSGHMKHIVSKNAMIYLGVTVYNHSLCHR